MTYEKCKWCGRDIKRGKGPYCGACEWYFEIYSDKIIVDGVLVDKICE